MRALHSYICGGKADWTADLTPALTAELVLPVGAATPSPLKKRGPGRPPKKRGRPKKLERLVPRLQSVALGTKLIRKRLGLSQARSQGIEELAAFANGKSKWNKRIPSSSSIGPDRIHRLIDRVTDKQIFVNTDQVRLLFLPQTRPLTLGSLTDCPRPFHACRTTSTKTPASDAA
jgi:hypothetical protein